jgi:hypothetical protein
MIIAFVIFGFCLLITLIIVTFWLSVYYFNFPITKEELKKELKKIREYEK